MSQFQKILTVLQPRQAVGMSCWDAANLRIIEYMVPPVEYKTTCQEWEAQPLFYIPSII